MDSDNMKRYRYPAPVLGQRLTPREEQTALLIADGMTTKTIAATMGVSIKTAERHRWFMMRKLGAHNAAQVIKAGAG
jgi:DNA-binding NarL/FixJ family response regulator